MNTSTPPRFNGTLKKWNAERGFGFVVAENGDLELFVHVSAFPRDGHQPVVGEPLSFEIQLGKDGRKRAVQVRRPGVVSAAPLRSRERPSETRQHVARRRPEPVRSSSVVGKLFLLVLLLAVGWFGYSQYQRYVSARSQSSPSPQGLMANPISSPSASPPAEPAFRCDGRLHCSQMTSCSEAKLFLKNCPGVKMDGDGDGVPCEQQLCLGG